MNNPIIVRLEVDYMKQSIIHAFQEREIELQEILRAELDKVISDYDFELEVRRQVSALFPELIREAVTKALRTAISADEVKSELSFKAMEAVRHFMDEARDR